MVNEKLVEKHMKNLGCSREEALELIAYDEAVDKGKKTEYDLTPEQKKVQKSMTITGTRETKAKTERKRAENPTKATIISEIAQFLSENSSENCENVEISNKERSISFKIGENSYEITLTQHRNAKKS